jgi:sulfur dioxygenase
MSGILFHQLSDSESNTYTYILADSRTRQAVIIDPVQEHFDRDAALIRKENYQLVWSLETHVHADHITSAHLLRQTFGTKTVSGEESGVECSDRRVRDGDVVQFGDLQLKVLATPGHTDGCVSYWLNDMIFTGDSLMIQSAGRTDFQGGSAGKLFDSIQRLLALPDETKIYPGHDYQGRLFSTVADEKKTNPRIAGKTREEFIALMNALKLDPPRKIKESVPANRVCGNVQKTAQKMHRS